MKRRTFLMVLFAISISVGVVATNFASTGTATVTATKSDEKPMCPVMKEEVEDISTAAYSDYKGKRYYFCCPACKPKFDKDPEKYLHPAPPK